MSPHVPISAEVAREEVRHHAAQGCPMCSIFLAVEGCVEAVRAMAPGDALMVATFCVEAGERMAREAGARS